jgi:Ca2+/H+ antiporter
MVQSPSAFRLRLTRLEKLLIGVGVVAGIAALVTAWAEKPDAANCRPTHTRSTELPIAVGALIVFVAVSMLLVNQNRDVYNKRRAARHQLGQVVVAAMITLFYAALAQLVLENGVCD